MKVGEDAKAGAIQSQALVANNVNWSGKAVSWIKNPSNLVIIMNTVVLFAAFSQLVKDLYYEGRFDKEIAFDSVTHFTSVLGVCLIAKWMLSAAKTNGILAAMIALNLIRMVWISSSLISGNSNIRPEQNAFDLFVPHCLTAAYAGHKLTEKEKQV